MAYSVNKKILYIHIPKNAGKSVEAALKFLPKNQLLKPTSRGFINSLAKFILNKTQKKDLREQLIGTFD